MVLKPAFLIATLLAASSVAASPRIYTYLDANGTRHYTDVPDNNRYRLLVLSPHDRTASGDRYDWMLLAKAGLHPQKGVWPGSGCEYYRAHVARLYGMRSGALGARRGL